MFVLRYILQRSTFFRWSSSFEGVVYQRVGIFAFWFQDDILSLLNCHNICSCSEVLCVPNKKERHIMKSKLLPQMSLPWCDCARLFSSTDLVSVATSHAIPEKRRRKVLLLPCIASLLFQILVITESLFPSILRFEWKLHHLEMDANKKFM